MGRPLADTLLLSPRNIIPAPRRYRQRSSIPDTGGLLTARRKVVIEAGLGHVSVWGRCRISQSIIVLLGIITAQLFRIFPKIWSEKILFAPHRVLNLAMIFVHTELSQIAVYWTLYTWDMMIRWMLKTILELKLNITTNSFDHWKDENKCFKKQRHEIWQ